MGDDLSNNDPKTIWQNQPTEASTMTLEKIRLQARELHAKTRRELLRNIVATLLAVTICGFGLAWAHDTVERAAFAAAIAWALAGQYVLNRGMWSATLPGDAALTTGLEFYRREIERRRDFFRRALRWSFGPAVLALGAFILLLVKSGIGSPGGLRKAIPFMSLAVVWLAAFFVIRIQRQRGLQREIDELNDIERENRP
jgi:hypothetical protein